MKQLFVTLKKRTKLVMDNNAATKDRTVGFQFAVTVLLSTAIFLITWYLIKIIP
ncbi:MAG: hypothetical protein ABUT20_11340 [Bacteroidota bacterium]